MLKSMTGFGALTLDNEQMSVNVEVKSLNSKFLDVSTKLSSSLSHKEIEIKALLGKLLERGKISLLLSYTNKKNTSERMIVNKALVSQYYQDLRSLAQSLQAPEQDLLRLAMNMPEACIAPPSSQVSEEEWQQIQLLLLKAIEACDEFRIKEGGVLYQAIRECCLHIGRLLGEVENKDPQRVENIREKLKTQVSEFVQSEHFDPNRFEQELIYYIERLDIAEEKVRLQSHLNYFLESMDEPNSGKKLNFIAQEIGREINTIGSKANDAAIQHLVVNMKEELEKIKEQLNNVV